MLGFRFPLTPYQALTHVPVGEGHSETQSFCLTKSGGICVLPWEQSLKGFPILPVAPVFAPRGHLGTSRQVALLDLLLALELPDEEEPLGRLLIGLGSLITGSLVRRLVPAIERWVFTTVQNRNAVFWAQKQ